MLVLVIHNIILLVFHIHSVSASVLRESALVLQYFESSLTDMKPIKVVRLVAFTLTALIVAGFLKVYLYPLESAAMIEKFQLSVHHKTHQKPAIELKDSQESSLNQINHAETPLPKPTPPKTFYNLEDNIEYSPLAKPTYPNPKSRFQDKTELDYYRYLMKIQFDCRHEERAGRKETTDGGWEVCLDPPYNMKPGGCLVYSFGIANDWSFDDYMDKKRNCEVHSFDPSIGKKDFQRSRNVQFHAMGLAGRNQTNGKKWRLYTLGSILRMLGHKNRTLDYLKMDIEGSEWDSLETMYREGVLKQVKQVGIEFHSVPDERKTGIINKLYEHGFRIYYSKRNYFNRIISSKTRRNIYQCMETHLVNINFMK